MPMAQFYNLQLTTNEYLMPMAQFYNLQLIFDAYGTISNEHLMP